MTIGIKYCGGCNPRWQRTQLAEWLGRDFPGARLLTGPAATSAEVLAIACGCPARCAGVVRQHPGGSFVLAGPQDYPALVQLLKAAGCT